MPIPLEVRPATLLQLIHDSIKPCEVEYTCHACGVTALNMKSTVYTALPGTLAFYMMRFEGDEVRSRKKSDEVQFPLLLNSSVFTEPGSGMYRLTGVVTHHGHFLWNGHYTATATSSGSGWHQYSDKDAKKIDEEEVLKEQASLLFYRQVCTFFIDKSTKNLLFINDQLFILHSHPRLTK